MRAECGAEVMCDIRNVTVLVQSNKEGQSEQTCVVRGEVGATSENQSVR